MTDIIQELRGLIAEATPGPWECDGAVLEYEGARFGEVAYVIGKAGQQFPAKAANAALIVAAINHLPALLDRLEAAEWRPIERKPEAPVNAVLWFPNMQFHDQHGDPFIFGGLRDILERYYLAFWDGEIWVESGTGHDVFEDWKSPDDLPTHWRPLPDAPAIDAALVGEG